MIFFLLGMIEKIILLNFLFKVIVNIKVQLEQFPSEAGSKWVGGQVSAVIWGYSDLDRAFSTFRVQKFLFFC